MRRSRMLGCAMTKKDPFAELAKLRASLPPGPEQKGVEKPGATAHATPARAVVRMERKGRGGKEVTVVEKLDLKPPDLEAWCRDLKSAMGCGGTVDGDVIVLQGDLRPRIAAVLEARGVARVTVAG